MIRVNSNIRAFRLRRRAEALTLSSSRRVLRTLIEMDEKASRAQPPSVDGDSPRFSRFARRLRGRFACARARWCAFRPWEVGHGSTLGWSVEGGLWTIQVINRLIHRLTHKLLTYNIALHSV